MSDGLGKDHVITARLPDTNLGQFSTRSEIGKVAEELKWWLAGGSNKPISLVSQALPDNITISKLWRLREDGGRTSTVLNSHGKELAIHDQPFADGNPWGKAFVLLGEVLDVRFSEHDANDRTSARTLTIVQSTTSIAWA